MTLDSAALDEVLSSMDVRLGRTRRAAVPAGSHVLLSRGVPTLGYVTHGGITVDPGTDTACAVDVAAGSAGPAAPGRALLAGDAFLTLGCRSLGLAASAAPGRLTLAEVVLTPPAGIQPLPAVIYVAGFARLEPAAAALAAHLAPPDHPPRSPRSGDPTICHLMVRTVLLSVIRAWAQAADPAGPGLPASGDAYLDRVVAAVRDDPGHTWTVDRLAVVGAMSRSVLSERFRAAFGRTPASYVTEVRMQRAMELLEAGQSVSDTSRALGYASDEGFSRAFRRSVGTVPSSWRSRRSAAGV